MAQQFCIGSLFDPLRTMTDVFARGCRSAHYNRNVMKLNRGSECPVLLERDDIVIIDKAQGYP